MDYGTFLSSVQNYFRKKDKHKGYIVFGDKCPVKIQIMGGKVCLRGKGKTMLFYFQKFVDITQQCFAFAPQLKFSDHNLIFQ